MLECSHGKVRDGTWQIEWRRNRRDKIVATLSSRRRAPTDARYRVAVGNGRIARLGPWHSVYRTVPKAPDRNNFDCSRQRTANGQEKTKQQAEQSENGKTATKSTISRTLTPAFVMSLSDHRRYVASIAFRSPPMDRPDSYQGGPAACSSTLSRPVTLRPRLPAGLPFFPVQRNDYDALSRPRT